MHPPKETVDTPKIRASHFSTAISSNTILQNTAAKVPLGSCILRAKSIEISLLTNLLAIQASFYHLARGNQLVITQRMSKNSGSVADAQSAQLHSTRQQVAILDFGSQYSHLIARRVRELHVFCELYSCLVKAEDLAKNNLVGVILSGGPASVYDPESPHVDPAVWALIRERNLPVLGICYGMQEIAHVFGGEVSPSAEREFGRAIVEKTVANAAAAGTLFDGVEHSQMWMSHGDKVTKMPANFVKIAHTENSEHAAIACPELRIYGLQFHPEVTHSIHGKQLLNNFVVGICKAPTDWNMQDIAEEFVQEVRDKVGPNGHVIGAVSGGVDSSVAAVLLHRAIGDRFHAVMVDNGCLRKDEAQRVRRTRNIHF
jgi:GMP synthase (glutamine-hydrolysing)